MTNDAKQNDSLIQSCTWTYT